MKGKTLWFTLLLVTITAVISSTGTYLWQKSLTTESLEKINIEYQRELGLMKDNMKQLQDTKTGSTLPTPNNQRIPKIESATFDGNGVIISGYGFSGSYLAFKTTNNPLCREIIEPTCVLHRRVSSDTNIEFISNWIGGKGPYAIYVENPLTGTSNEVTFEILET